MQSEQKKGETDVQYIERLNRERISASPPLHTVYLNDTGGLDESEKQKLQNKPKIITQPQSCWDSFSRLFTGVSCCCQSKEDSDDDYSPVMERRDQKLIR
jgi:hypothetical protein